ncbi:MAG: N-6 DNA methylase, partial [Candidatus Cloacimonetes bacterium]|nr:N-6 DNA methylase [Candidatus Cloacimonadota bacterium]
FAEDTNIFEEGQFTNAVSSHTQGDGSDLDAYLDKLFVVLNTPEKDRQDLSAYLNAFPYVNGGLFRQRLQMPKFTRRSHRAIIDSGELDWSVINPDIFGSMMQAVISTEQRGGFGVHYTSVPNIMKVIEPLFLNGLKEDFEKAKGNQKKRNEYLKRLQNIKIFDPACGSGNFLVIAYKELRKLEMEIFKEQRSALPISGISLKQFFGIEIDDFAHEIAQLSLWLAEHQMNVEFFNEFGRTNPTLPLKESGNIVQGNACRIDWEEVCPKKEGTEVYILGNPPYLGFLQQTKEQKSDMDFVFHDKENIKKLDYITCWFYLGANYLQDKNAKLGLVSTNSIIQGEQVALFWPHILNGMNVEIGFAHQSFNWNNSAKSNAGITCVIIGLRPKINSPKYLFTDNVKSEVANINAYLSPSRNIFVTKLTNPISQFPRISLGSSAYDGGYLMITPEERAEVIDLCPEAKNLFRLFVGSVEFVRGIERYCLWIEDSQLDLANSIPFIQKRLENVKKFREGSKRGQTFETATTPHRFTEYRHKDKPSLLVPIVTSERREYLTLGFLSKGEVIPNSARAVFDSEPYLFGVLSSKIHMAWVKAVGGRLRTDVRYSAGVCYNSFPLPPISDQRKQEITQCVFRILEEREKHPEKTIAQLYDPDKMPEGLREAHRLNDLAVERCYRSKPFESDEERLEYLFKLYEKTTSEEQER